MSFVPMSSLMFQRLAATWVRALGWSSCLWLFTMSSMPHRTGFYGMLVIRFELFSLFSDLSFMNFKLYHSMFNRQIMACDGSSVPLDSNFHMLWHELNMYMIIYPTLRIAILKFFNFLYFFFVSSRFSVLSPQNPHWEKR